MSGKIEFRAPELKIFPVGIAQDKPSVFHGKRRVLQFRIDIRTRQSPDSESGGTELEISVDDGVRFSCRKHSAGGKEKNHGKESHA